VLTLEDLDGGISLLDVLLLVVASSGDCILGRVKSLSDNGHILLGLCIAFLSGGKEALGRVDSSDGSFLLFDGLIKLSFHSLGFVPECEVLFNFLRTMSELALVSMEVTSLLLNPVLVCGGVNQTLLKSLDAIGLSRADLVLILGEAVRGQGLSTALDDSGSAEIVDFSISWAAVDIVIASECPASVILQARLIVALVLEILVHISKPLSFLLENSNVLPVFSLELLDVSHSILSGFLDLSLNSLHVLNHVLETILASVRAGLGLVGGTDTVLNVTFKPAS